MGARQIDYPSPFLGDRNFRPPDRFQLRLRTRRVESTGGVDEHETDNSDGLLNFPLGCQQQRLAMLRKSFLRRAWLTNPPNSPVSNLSTGFPCIIVFTVTGSNTRESR
jgi:hypothetical protein